jgi:hypothetical protein
MQLHKLSLIILLLSTTNIFCNEQVFNEPFKGKEWDFLAYKLVYRPDGKFIAKVLTTAASAAIILPVVTYRATGNV